MSELNISLLPQTTSSSFLAQQERYLHQQAEVILKQLVGELRQGTMTWQSAACGIGRIAGYYDLLAELTREQTRREADAHANLKGVMT